MNESLKKFLTTLSSTAKDEWLLTMTKLLSGLNRYATYTHSILLMPCTTYTLLTPVVLVLLGNFHQITDYIILFVEDEHFLSSFLH